MQHKKSLIDINKYIENLKYLCINETIYETDIFSSDTEILSQSDIIHFCIMYLY